MVTSPYFEPYNFKLITLKNAYLDSGRHVVLSSSSKFDKYDMACRIQSLSLGKYEKAFECSESHKRLITKSVGDVLYVPTYQNFYHNMIDGVPRAFAATVNRKMDVVMSDSHIKTFNNMYDVLVNWLPCNSLTTYPISASIIMCYGTESRLKADKLSFLSTSEKSSKMDVRHVNKRIALAFWRKFAEDHWPTVKPHRRLFIRRTVNNPSLSNRCLNQNEIFNFLSKEYGFEEWDPSNHPFIKTAKVFSEASFVIGVHGAGMASIAFCQPETRILELVSMGGKSQIFFGSLAQPGRFKFSQLSGHLPGRESELIKGEFEQKFLIDIKKLGKSVLSLL